MGVRQKPGGDNDEGREQRAGSCRDLCETGQETVVSTEGRGRETHLRHRNKPLTLRFSGSTIFKQIKNKGRGNREQLVTFKNLKSRMLLATKKAKVRFKIKLKGKQVQQRSGGLFEVSLVRIVCFLPLANTKKGTPGQVSADSDCCFSFSQTLCS